MPTLDNTTENAEQRRILAFGTPNTRKTWWALRAATMGYNVILMDFDNGWQIAKQMPDFTEASKRIFRIDARAPKSDADKNHALSAFMNALSTDGVFYDIEARVKSTAKTFSADNNYVRFDLSALSYNDVVILDSWTALCDLIVDPAKETVKGVMDVERLEQSQYGEMRVLSDRLLNRLQRLNCHVIVIGHAVEYAKRKADASSKAKPDEAIESISTVLSSVTKAHGSSIGRHFSDVLYFDLKNSMAGVTISTKGRDDLKVGSRSMEPKSASWEEMGIENFLPPVSNKPEAFNSKAVTDVSGAELIAMATEAQGKKGNASSLDASKTSLIKGFKTT